MPDELGEVPIDLVEELGIDWLSSVHLLPRAEVRSRSGALRILHRGDRRFVAPYGLDLLNMPLLRARAAAKDAAASAEQVAVVPRPARNVSLLDPAALAQTAPESPVAPDEAADDETDLLPPGVVEARLLRDVPDLIGALVAPPTMAAVELVACLATHQHRATTALLRDALGTVRQDTSRASSTVWAAVGAVRRCAGAGPYPVATGNQRHVLSETVTCDWIRFRALVDLGRTSTDRRLERRALAEAIALVEGIPGPASRRFAWLEAEGLLEVIRREVGEAAERLARLELDALENGQGSVDTMQAAPRAGRLLLPHGQRWWALGARLHEHLTSAFACARSATSPDSRSDSRSI